MRWDDEWRWVSDEHGLRYYFSECDPGGPTRLDCYRQLLAEPVDMDEVDDQAPHPRIAGVALVRRLAELLDLARPSWRSQAGVTHQIAGL